MVDYLVTGAAGQLGRITLQLAKKRGKDAAGADVPGAGLEQVSVDDRTQVLRWVLKYRPRAVLHLGAWTDVDGCELNPRKAEAVNGHGTANVAAACAAVGCRLVYVSTDFVFDGRATAPLPVDAMPGPLSAYGWSKLSGERAVLAAAQPGFCVVRTSWVFGPGGKNFPRAILNKALKGENLQVVNDQVGRPTYTEDLADAILDVAEAPGASGVYHCSNEGQCSWYDFARDIVREAGCKVDVAPISSAQMVRPARRPTYSVLDTSRLAALRGKPLPHYLDAVRRYLKEELK
ncbi:MAG: dTDP-4-dehydrorhamnose reductase [Planctomycetota bacterium]